MNKTSLFVSNIPKDKDNIFLHNPEEKNIPIKQKSIFENILQNSSDNLIKSIDTLTVQSNNQTNNDTQNKPPNNLFTGSSSNNASNKDIFSSKQNTNQRNIFKMETNTQNTQQPTQNNQGGLSIFQRNQNQKTQISITFGNINSNVSINTEIFKNLNLSSTTQNNTNALETNYFR